MEVMKTAGTEQMRQTIQNCEALILRKQEASTQLETEYKKLLDRERSERKSLLRLLENHFG